MSANRFTIACWTFGSGARGPPNMSSPGQRDPMTKIQSRLRKQALHSSGRDTPLNCGSQSLTCRRSQIRYCSAVGVGYCCRGKVYKADRPEAVVRRLSPIHSRGGPMPRLPSGQVPYWQRWCCARSATGFAIGYRDCPRGLSPSTWNTVPVSAFDGMAAPPNWSEPQKYLSQSHWDR